MTSAAPSPGSSRACNALDMAVEAMMETLSRTPGIRHPRSPTLSPRGSDTVVSVSVEAWTTAMARRRVDWRFTAPTATLPDGSEPDAAFLGDALALQYGQCVLLQTQRTRLAQSHHLHDYGDERLSPSHFVVDASVATLLAESRIDPGDIVTWLRRTGDDAGDRRWHRHGTTYPSSRITVALVAVGTVPPGMDGADGALLAPTLVIGKPGGTQAWLTDREVSVEAAIPETVLAGAPGRRLGDVVETGIGHLDARTVESTRTTSGRSMLTLERERMTIAEARDLPRGKPKHRSTRP